MLLDRCKLSQQILDLTEHRAIASHSSGFVVQDNLSGPVSSQSLLHISLYDIAIYPHGLTIAIRTSGFLGLIRLQNDTAIITAYSYNANTGTTTGIILQADEAEMKAIKEHILYHKASTGHELLLRIILTEMSLRVCVEHLSEVKQDVMDIEHSTGQHTWHNYSARGEKPETDVELSRVAHGLRIQVAVVCRRIEVVTIWIELLLESLTQDQKNSACTTSMLQWVRNMKTQVKMAKLDVDLIAKRAENQVGAVSNADSSGALPPYSIPGCSLRYVRFMIDSRSEIILQPRRYPRPPIVILPP